MNLRAFFRHGIGLALGPGVRGSGPEAPEKNTIWKGPVLGGAASGALVEAAA